MSDMWIFKADVTGCFDQLYWDQSQTPFMGFMLPDDAHAHMHAASE